MKRIIPFIILLLALTAFTAFPLLALTATTAFQVQTLETTWMDIPQVDSIEVEE